MRMILVGLLTAFLARDVVAHPQPYFRCTMAATSNGWCQGCRAGYLATPRCSLIIFTAEPASGA